MIIPEIFGAKGDGITDDTTVDLMANMGANNINHSDYFSDDVHINDGKGGKKVSELITRKLLEIEPFFI